MNWTTAFEIQKREVKTDLPSSVNLNTYDQSAETVTHGEGRSSSNIEELIKNELGNQVLQMVKEHTGTDPMETFVTATSTRFNIEKLPGKVYQNIVNLKRINDIRRINKFFETVNEKLPEGGIYVGSVETYSNRKSRILSRSIYPFNWIHYTMDVMVKRVIPKVPVTKKIYFFITKGRNRVLSKAETFGRLYSCGFEIVNEKFIGDRLYYVARKVKEPAFPKNPTYGPLIRLKRHGKDGRMFNVYKLRTMHAYSEYLQEYVYQHNDLQEGGKFKNDFRITTEGKIFRKFWLDELPMFFNLIKGNMKLVGVRPLSSHYFNLYSDELKEKRIKTRPGLIPPFYADMPETLEEIMESEMKYLEAHAKNPVKTDISYFFKALNNILIKRARSN
jgi:lipopolysaccharide/colanic/teichoic acid biosynthesis glycosyltransferase